MARFTLLVCLQLGIILASASTTVPGQCEADCTCIGEAVRAEGGVGKVEGLAAAVAALTPVVLGGAGLGLYKMLTAGKSGVTPAMPDGGPTDLPKQQMKGLSSNRVPSDKGSPSSYHKDLRRGSVPSDKGTPSFYSSDLRRGSMPLSLFSEDDDLSTTDSSPRSVRPDTSSNRVNIHRPFKGDTLNRWL